MNPCLPTTGPRGCRVLTISRTTGLHSRSDARFAREALQCFGRVWRAARRVNEVGADYERNPADLPHEPAWFQSTQTADFTSNQT